jgi:signal peptidase I
MEPNLYRGDVMLLQGINSKELKAPEISFNYPTLNNVQLSDLSQTICVDNQGNINSCDYFRKLLILNLIKAQDFTTQKIVFVNNKEITLNKEGDIIVYFSEEAGIPIIHRVVAKLKANDGYYFLTKGDSKLNPLIDQDKVLSLYPLPEKKVVGKTILRIPLIGYVKLLLIDDLQVLLFGCPKGMQCVLP